MSGHGVCASDWKDEMRSSGLTAFRHYRKAFLWGKAFPLAGDVVAGTPPSAGRPRNAPSPAIN